MLKIRDWFKINKLSINITKTKIMIFSPEKKCNKVKLYYDKTSLEKVKTIKYLVCFLMKTSTGADKGVGRKFFRWGNGKRPKISKKYRKIALFAFFRWRGQRKKRPKNSKKGRK